MATCQHCEREMTTHVSCTPCPVLIDGVEHPQVPYGQELIHTTGLPVPGGLVGPHPPTPTCRDCGCPVGGWHHPGCDREGCPVCGHQLISCGCLDEDEDGTGEQGE